MPGLTVRPMRRADLDLALDWAAAEGWNPGRHDAEAFWAADPGGFLVGEVEGEPACVISVVRYGDDFGFLGLYIARPDRRGQGHGIGVWRAGMALLRERCVGLDGVVAQQDNYRRSGFVLAQRNIRFAAERPVRPAAPLGPQIAAAGSVPFEDIAAYDRTCFPAPRDTFLRAWLTLPGHVALAVRRRGALAGYAVLRPCRTGMKIGPLFADDPETAAALIRGLLDAAPAGPVFLDVPEPHAAAVALAREAGMEPVFETARMYTRAPPVTDAARIFGITTFELG